MVLEGGSSAWPSDIHLESFKVRVPLAPAAEYIVYLYSPLEQGFPLTFAFTRESMPLEPPWNTSTGISTHNSGTFAYWSDDSVSQYINHGARSSLKEFLLPVSQETALRLHVSQMDFIRVVKYHFCFLCTQLIAAAIYMMVWSFSCLKQEDSLRSQGQHHALVFSTLSPQLC